MERLIFKDDPFFILEEFESDRMSPRKSGRIGAHGLNWKIFVNFDLRFEIFDKNPLNIRDLLGDEF